MEEILSPTKEVLKLVDCSNCTQVSEMLGSQKPHYC